MTARFATLEQWLRWQETLHPRAIDLGLERALRIYNAMGVSAPAHHIVTVAGTNGKGSAVAMLERLFLDAGYRVGAYTSPHLVHYNERIRVDGRAVSDDELISAFETVDAARGSESLTYFEFGTLAALAIFARAPLDLVLLEVGLGGRLDATNIVDADIALITSIGLDHQQWLGMTREHIAREKAGVARPGRPLVFADPAPPANLEEAARGAVLYRLGREFHYRLEKNGWHWRGGDRELPALPAPVPAATVRYCNAAGVVQVAELLAPVLPYSEENLKSALAGAAPPGRCQRVGTHPEIWLDVAHNTDSINALVEVMQDKPVTPTHLVFGVLADKPVEEMVRALSPLADHWHIGAPYCRRSLAVAALQPVVEKVADRVTVYPDLNAAFVAARRAAGENGRVIVTGSFYTVAEVMMAQCLG